MSRPLAVLMPEVGVLSETFLEWDANHLLPSGTVVVSDPPPRGSTVLHGPMWTTGAPHLIFEPVPGDPLPTFGRRREVATFLRQHGVQVVMVEYLDFAERWLEQLSDLDVPVWVRGYGADLSARLTDRYCRFNALAGVIVPTMAAARRLSGIGVMDDRLHVIPNHVDVPDNPPTCEGSADVVRCVSVGRLVEKKGHRYLIEAVAHAVRRQPRLRLDIIGDGPLRAALQAQIDGAELGAKVRLLGGMPLSQVAADLRSADLFAHHAVTATDGDVETQPLAILHAMASGLPVITTRHEGIPEIFIDRENGWLVDERDVEATAAALTALAEDAEHRCRMGQAAWQTVKERHTHDQARATLLRLLGLADREGIR